MFSTGTPKPKRIAPRGQFAFNTAALRASDDFKALEFRARVGIAKDGRHKMSQIDPWEKAAECVRAIQISIDPHRKAMLINLQQMWIELANQRNFLTEEQLAREVETIGRLHVKFGGEDSVQIH
jgi:hypothetical protein